MLRLFALSEFVALALGSGYVRTDPVAYDPAFASEVEFDRRRSASECFCGRSKHAEYWHRFLEELHDGLSGDPGFAGEWVHGVCRKAYPVIFKAVSVDPVDDALTIHADCPAGVLAMAVVCAQSSALQYAQVEPVTAAGNTAAASLPVSATALVGGDAPIQELWLRARRVVRDEGPGVNDLFGPVPLAQCLESCEADTRCRSVAHGPQGCHLKARCVEQDDGLVDEEDSTEGYHTYFYEACTGVVASRASQAWAPSGRHLREVQNMLTFALRTLDFCLHCLDASPWPFLLEEVLSNYARAVEAPEDFVWMRATGSAAGPSTWPGPGSDDEALGSDEPVVWGGDPGASMLPERFTLLRMRVHWIRGLEGEASFWKDKLSLDPEENNSLERLRTWLSTGQVTWYYDDPCTWLADRMRRVAGSRSSNAQRAPPRILNAGCGPFAPGPLQCDLDPRWLPESAAVDGQAAAVSWSVPVVAADGLARYYLRAFNDKGHVPLHSPVQCPAEELHVCFPPSHFDIAHVRNALDHAFDPLRGIERLLHVVRPGGWLLLRHARNEGVPGNFRNGLHQWAFDVAPRASDADARGGPTSFVIWSPKLRADVTEHLLRSGLAAEVRTELKMHPSPDAPPDERYVWVEIRKPLRGGDNTNNNAPVG